MGGGKSYCGLLRHLRWVHDPHYRGFIIRKNSTTLAKSGGLFDEAKQLYRAFDPRVQVKIKDMKFIFPSGAEIALSHLETDEDAEKYRGLQISAAMIDEATQISEEHTLVVLSRLRSKAKMIPNLFLTCNPSPDSYLRKWIDWWIIPKGQKNAGRVDPERDGVVRWFIRQDNQMIWADTKEELITTYGKDVLPISLQMISANIFDNPPLIKANPNYLATLQGLKKVKKERDLYGNWDIREDASGYFKKEWLGEPVNPYNYEVVSRCRAWDIAGKLPTDQLPNPDWTVGVLIAKTRCGSYIIEDVIRFRARYGEVIKRMVETAMCDPLGTQIILPQEPGQAGIAAGQMMIKEFLAAGFGARMRPTNKSKTIRFQPFAAAAEAGLVAYESGPWNDVYFEELEAFTGERKNSDDQVDATSDAFITLAQKIQIPSGWASGVAAMSQTNNNPLLRI